MYERAGGRLVSDVRKKYCTCHSYHRKSIVNYHCYVLDCRTVSADVAWRLALGVLSLRFDENRSNFSVILLCSSGIFGVFFCILWFFTVSDSPKKAKWIKQREIDYITRCEHIQQHGERVNPKEVPWSKILSSMAVWSSALCSFSSFLHFYLLKSLKRSWLYL